MKSKVGINSTKLATRFSSVKHIDGMNVIYWLQMETTVGLCRCHRSVCQVNSAEHVRRIPCLHKQRLRWEICVGGGVLRGPSLTKEGCVTELDGQVARGRVLGLSCCVLAQIRDTHSQTIAYKNETEKRPSWGGEKGRLFVPTCAVPCSQIRALAPAAKATHQKPFWIWNKRPLLAEPLPGATLDVRDPFQITLGGGEAVCGASNRFIIGKKN